MFKKIFGIICVILLFVTASLIFWAGLAPDSFYNFFIGYPAVRQVTNQLSSVVPIPKVLQATTSEPILGLTGQLLVGSGSWNVEIANSETARTAGLSNRKVLRSNNGLLFAFDQPSNQAFWMKDMLIPIDMVFFDDNWQIVLIEANLQPNSFPKIYGAKVKSKYVLEINANEASLYGLQVGNQAIFLNK